MDHEVVECVKDVAKLTLGLDHNLRDEVKDLPHQRTDFLLLLYQASDQQYDVIFKADLLRL